jgi:hypothetical protein
MYAAILHRTVERVTLGEERALLDQPRAVL